MRAVEELVRRKLEKRAPDELSPKPDPYELRAPQGCNFLFPTATQTEGNRSGQTLLSQNPTGVKLNGDWSSNTVSEIQQKQLSDSTKRSNSKLSDRTVYYLSVARQSLKARLRINQFSK